MVLTTAENLYLQPLQYSDLLPTLTEIVERTVTDFLREQRNPSRIERQDIKFLRTVIHALYFVPGRSPEGAKGKFRTSIDEVLQREGYRLIPGRVRYDEALGKKVQEQEWCYERKEER